jgi:DNA-binding HxlR family transcriptional regulator
MIRCYDVGGPHLHLSRVPGDEGEVVSAVRTAASQRGSRAAEGRRPPSGDLELIHRVDDALDVLHGKWKVHLLFFMARGIHRHSRLLDCLAGASKKVMIDTLRALERDGLVDRRVCAEVPARVEYCLTPLGWTITAPLVALSEWAETHSGEVATARSQYHVAGGSSDAAQAPAARSSAAT